MTPKLQSTLNAIREIHGRFPDTGGDPRIAQITKDLAELAPALEAEVVALDQRLKTLENQIKHLGH